MCGQRILIYILREETAAYITVSSALKSAKIKNVLGGRNNFVYLQSG